jgi:hypothetical protein
MVRLGLSEAIFESARSSSTLRVVSCAVSESWNDGMHGMRRMDKAGEIYKRLFRECIIDGSREGECVK